MGYFFTLLYIATAYITPTVLFGQLAPYHLEIVIAACAVLASIPNLPSSGIWRLPELYAALAVGVAVVMSFVGNLYFGGAPPATYGYLISFMGFFLAAVNCRSPRQLKGIVLVLFLCSTYYIFRGWLDVYHHHSPSPFVFEEFGTLARIRGLGFVNDPNDFAQVMVSLIPCVLLWRTKSKFANVFLCGIPIAILITGMYLTHSRGAAIALMVVCAISFRRRIGTVPAAVIGGLLLAGILALGWSGGRAVSMEAGADRMDAWSVGIELIKHHPLFGVGLRRFADYNDITAHNSIVVCAAEIGIPGFICWVLFLFSTYRLGLLPAEADPDKPLTLPIPKDGHLPSAHDLWMAQRTAVPTVAPMPSSDTPELVRSGPFGVPSQPTQSIDPAELRRIARWIIIGLTGFLAAGWFLSRAIAIWLFLEVGLVCAVARMAQENGIALRQDKPVWLIKWSVLIGLFLIVLVYLLLRFRNLTGQ